MTVTHDLSFLSLIGNASMLVQLVMLVLLLVSIMSWTYIFQKTMAIRAAQRQTKEFERIFWSGGNLMSLYQDTSSNRREGRGEGGALERIFHAGMGEFIKAKTAQNNKGVVDTNQLLDGARRSMRAAYQREIDGLESHLAFLASVGSVSPYIGLFGTVWGIMNAFRGLGSVEQPTLAVVAPGIAEALIATAIGLFAAIPAVVAYNRYSHEIDRLSMRFETFVEEFSNILQRQAQ